MTWNIHKQKNKKHFKDFVMFYDVTICWDNIFTYVCVYVCMQVYGGICETVSENQVTFTPNLSSHTLFTLQDFEFISQYLESSRISLRTF